MTYPRLGLFVDPAADFRTIPPKFTRIYEHARSNMPLVFAHLLLKFARICEHVRRTTEHEYFNFLQTPYAYL